MVYLQDLSSGATASFADVPCTYLSWRCTARYLAGGEDEGGRRSQREEEREKGSWEQGLNLREKKWRRKIAYGLRACDRLPLDKGSTGLAAFPVYLRIGIGWHSIGIIISARQSSVSELLIRSDRGVEDVPGDGG